MFISLVQLFFMSLSTVFSLILCENQGLTINQLLGGCLGACKVPGAPEPPQASPGRVHRLGNGRLTGERTLCRANLQQYWVPRKPNQSESVGASGAVWAPGASTGGVVEGIRSSSRSRGAAAGNCRGRGGLPAWSPRRGRSAAGRPELGKPLARDSQRLWQRHTRQPPALPPAA